MSIKKIKYDHMMM